MKLARVLAGVLAAVLIGAGTVVASAPPAEASVVRCEWRRTSYYPIVWKLYCWSQGGDGFGGGGGGGW